MRRALALTLAAAVLSGCGVVVGGEEDPATRSGGDDSRLDRPGVDQILASGEARFDLRDLELTRDDVGLRPGRLGPLVGGDDRVVDLTLRGPRGDVTVATPTFAATFSTTADRARSVTWFEHHDTDAEAYAALEDAVDTWGLPADSLADRSDVLGIPEDERRSLPLGVSPTGFVTQVTIQGSDGEAGQTHRWSVSLDPRDYEPGVLRQIRRTGVAPPPS